MSGILNSSIGRKFAMALSALFLMVFLLQHFSINILSVFSPDAFNEVSHFMGTFWVIQYLLQPVLIFGVIFGYFLMDEIITLKVLVSLVVILFGIYIFKKNNRGLQN